MNKNNQKIKELLSEWKNYYHSHLNYHTTATSHFTKTSTQPIMSFGNMKEKEQTFVTSWKSHFKLQESQSNNRQHLYESFIVSLVTIYELNLFEKITHLCEDLDYQKIKFYLQYKNHLKKTKYV